MEADKRKREGDEEANGKRGKEAYINGVNGELSSSSGQVVPSDEEVEEFFAILKRIQVAVEYFKRRRDQADGGQSTEVTSWGSYFEAKDSSNGGVRKVTTDEKYEEEEEDKERASLDLNSDPVCDVSDGSV